MKEPLQKWISEQIVADEMLWKGAWGDQVQFVRDSLAHLVGRGLSYKQFKTADVATVISTHRSKSIALPVYELARADLGLRLVLRNNFYDWKLSVISEDPVVADFEGLFRTTSPIEPAYTGNELASVYFEGFPRSLVFGYYAESDRRQWSAAIGGDSAMWTTVFIIMKALGAVKPMKWHTQESHRAQLAAERAEEG